MPLWNILFFCCSENELFSQQLLGVRVMPSCVGCSVKILFASSCNNFQEIITFIIVFLVATREFYRRFFQCEIS